MDRENYFSGAPHKKAVLGAEEELPRSYSDVLGMFNETYKLDDSLARALSPEAINEFETSIPSLDNEIEDDLKGLLEQITIGINTLNSLSAFTYQIAPQKRPSQLAGLLRDLQCEEGYGIAQGEVFRLVTKMRLGLTLPYAPEFTGKPKLQDEYDKVLSFVGQEAITYPSGERFLETDRAKQIRISSNARAFMEVAGVSFFIAQCQPLALLASESPEDSEAFQALWKHYQPNLFASNQNLKIHAINDLAVLAGNLSDKYRDSDWQRAEIFALQTRIVRSASYDLASFFDAARSILQDKGGKAQPESRTPQHNPEQIAQLEQRGVDLQLEADEVFKGLVLPSAKFKKLGLRRLENVLVKPNGGFELPSAFAKEIVETLYFLSNQLQSKNPSLDECYRLIQLESDLKDRIAVLGHEAESVGIATDVSVFKLDESLTYIKCTWPQLKEAVTDHWPDFDGADFAEALSKYIIAEPEQQ